MITCKKTNVKASPFKVAYEQTPIISIIEQNNFTNESLYIIGQKLDCIEEKIVEKNLVSKTEKPLIDLPSQDGKLKFKNFTKNWYSKPTPPDMQFEERGFQTQFSVSANKIYEWNIDGFSEQEIINKMSHMSMVGIAYVNNHNLDHPEIVDLLVTGFSGTLHGWWDSYLTEDSRESIKHAVKKNDEGLPIFDESIGKGIPDGVNTLVYTILKHFIGTPSNISSRISDYLNNLRCPTMSDYKWYQDVSISRVMLRKDCYKPYWKEKFIDGLPPIFAHKVK